MSIVGRDLCLLPAAPCCIFQACQLSFVILGIASWWPVETGNSVRAGLALRSRWLLEKIWQAAGLKKQPQMLVLQFATEWVRL